MKTLLLAIIMMLQVPVFSQMKSEMQPKSEAGKCYAKVYAKYEKKEMTLFIYTGKEAKDITLHTLFFKLDKQTDQLIYLGRVGALKKWDLGPHSAGIKEFVFVQDTSETQEVMEQTFEYLELRKRNETLRWAEVLCENDLSKNLVEIQEALEKRKYLSPPFESVFGNKTRDAMFEFQKDNLLPVGHFDLQTLESLEIEISR